MKWKDKKPVLFMLVFSGIVLFIFLLMQPAQILYIGQSIDLLFAKGIIAIKERDLLFIIQAIMLLVVIPVYILTFVFSWKYQAHNPRGKYNPDLDENTLAEVIWWGLPLVITLIIGILTWIKTYELDPFRPLESEKKPVKIQVIALQWKWLFLYPEEKIASLNYVHVPEKTPINFEITSDAPMNSFWIPQLGGQIYAMPSMRTKLHLIADEPGLYNGSSANLSGKGFAGMRFLCEASNEEDYLKWIEEQKQSQNTLDMKKYEELAQPSSHAPVITYVLEDDNLFNKIIMKFMHPQMSH